MHDANGTPLKVGDEVMIPATITQLSETSDYCNVTAVSKYGRRPDGAQETLTAINTGVLVKWASATVVLAFVLALTGCGSGSGSTPATAPGTTAVSAPAQPNPLIALGIQEGADLGTSQGLKALAKSNPAAAAETAFNLKNSISNDLLPFLQGGKLQTAAEVQTLLASSLFKGKIDPTVQNLIAAAASALQAYVPLSDPGKVLNPAEIAYISAFLSGVSAGCTDYNTKALKQPTQARWVPFSTE